MTTLFSRSVRSIDRIDDPFHEGFRRQDTLGPYPRAHGENAHRNPERFYRIADNRGPEGHLGNGAGAC